MTTEKIPVCKHALTETKATTRDQVFGDHDTAFNNKGNLYL